MGGVLARTRKLSKRDINDVTANTEHALGNISVGYSEIFVVVDHYAEGSSIANASRYVRLCDTGNNSMNYELNPG